MDQTVQKQTILIVDDTPENIDVLRGLLRENYKLKVAIDGEKALKIIMSENPPDLILLDIMMPGIDGYEVCRRIKQDKVYKDIPVIFITAKDSVEDKLHGFEVGAVDYVAKPFQAEEVLARVRTHLELKLAYETIHRYNERLEQMLDLRTKELIQCERQAAFGQLVQGIVHNLRGPLSTSSMANQMIEIAWEKYQSLTNPTKEQEISLLRPLAQDVRKFSEIICNSNKKIDEMLQSLLIKSRSDKSNEIEATDLNSIIEREIEFLQADLHFKHGVEKKVELYPGPLMLYIVPGEISQVFENIVRNALDAMYETSNPMLVIRTNIEDNNVVLSIGDNGTGIPDDIRGRIFDPFFTTKVSSKNNGESSNKPSGTGLGLWMCKETIKSYGGKILVDSAVGKGTVFKVILPLSDKSQSLSIQ